MNDQQNRHIDTLIERIPRLLGCRQDINDAYVLLKKAYSNNRKLLVCGNGGSASDSEHIVGELMKEFRLKRKVYVNQAEAMKAIDPEMGQILAENLQGALPAICLTGHSALTTAFMNDANADLIFAQQVNGYGKPNDVFLGISTSGNSKNVLYAAITAKSKGLRVPETETYKIQELHVPVYHCLCLMLEEYFFGRD